MRFSRFATVVLCAVFFHGVIYAQDKIDIKAGSRIRAHIPVSARMWDSYPNKRIALSEDRDHLLLDGHIYGIQEGLIEIKQFKTQIFYTAPLNAISRMEIYKGSRMLVGGILGLVTGVLIAGLIEDQTNNIEPGFLGDLDRSVRQTKFTLVGLGAGLVAGVIVGSKFHKWKEFDLTTIKRN